uniref:Uncharacterized protein LOC110194389 n=1 Tax=Phascolarctos cinereus TaxID=38626 RepID=A0A6P5IK60_PHACI|nr:uncharacterized protein LOC110194389 [Phascolarctos cinereus]
MPQTFPGKKPGSASARRLIRRSLSAPPPRPERRGRGAGRVNLAVFPRPTPAQVIGGWALAGISHWSRSRHGADWPGARREARRLARSGSSRPPLGSLIGPSCNRQQPLVWDASLETRFRILGVPPDVQAGPSSPRPGPIAEISVRSPFLCDPSGLQSVPVSPGCLRLSFTHLSGFGASVSSLPLSPRPARTFHTDRSLLHPSLLNFCMLFQP